MNHHHTKTILASLCSATILLSSSSVFAVGKGDWLVRAGVGYVSPNDSSSDVSGLPAGSKVSVDSAANVDLTIAYMLTPNVNVELLGALPFKHDIKGKGTTANGVKIAETKELPPTLMVDYMFNPKSNIRPYIGAGMNYTTFFSTKTTGPLSGIDLKLNDSWGLAAQAGVDIDLNQDLFFNASIWYMNIKTKGTLSGGLGTVDVNINPWALSVGIGTHF